MQKLLLLGDEAIAMGAIDAGLSGMYAYPGTPSTEIMEFVQASSEAKLRNIHREWSSNEKTALEARSNRRILVYGYRYRIAAGGSHVHYGVLQGSRVLRRLE